MVIKNTRRSRSAARRPQVKETPKVEEKKIEEAEIKEEPQIEAVIEEAPLQGDIEELDQQIKKPREKRIVKKQISAQKGDNIEDLLEKLMNKDE